MYCVIATAGRPRLLKSTLESIAAAEKPSSFREVIVVENGPAQGAAQIVNGLQTKHPGIYRYVYTSIANKSAALNLCLTAVNDGLIVFTDDDVTVRSDWFTRYAEAAVGKMEGEFYGGSVEPHFERSPPPWLFQYFPSSVAGFSLDGADAPDNPIFLGCNWAAFARDLHRAGGFDDQRGPGAVTGSTGQETHMQRRLLERGVRARYLSKIPVAHYVPEDRCSEEWALTRKYRAAIDMGLSDATDAPLLFGYPRWAVRRYLEAAVRYALSQVRRTPQYRFAARFQYKTITGYLRGWSMRHSRGVGGKKDL